MKWVKCINPLAAALTYNKIYEVVNYYEWNGLKYIELINNAGNLVTYDMFPSHPNDKIWFEDATADIRDIKLKLLGI
jgi:hypothetical protein